MTFTRFEELVKEKHPKARIFSHGEYAGNKINVTIIFNGTNNEKVYQYNGTYCEVLNKLGIKAIYKHDYENLKSTLESYKEKNGTKCPFFGTVYDYNDRIDELVREIFYIQKTHVIV